MIITIISLGIIIFDLGNFVDHTYGAGEIWWTELEEIFLNNK